MRCLASLQYIMTFVKAILNRFLVVVTGLFIISTIHASTINTDCRIADCQIKDTETYMDDWVVNPTNKFCGGFYTQAPLPHPEQTVTVLPNQPAVITADRGQFISDRGPSTLEGDVHLIQGNRQIKTNLARIYRNQDTLKLDKIEAFGQVEILEPDLRLKGSEAYVFVPQDIKILKNSEFRLYDRHARGEAREITVFGQDKMILRKATYTTCSPLQNTWHVRAKKIVLNKITGRGQASHARLYAYDVPIFYIPYMDFPIDDRRKTGFLYPLIGGSRNRGLEFSTPFYWNMAPNYDATITPRYLSQRGIDVRTASRYLWQRGNGVFDFSYLPHDKAYRKFKESQLNNLLNNPLNNPRNIPIDDPRLSALRRESDSRYNMFTQHNMRYNRHWRANAQYHKVSDDNYFFDLGDTLELASTVQLLQTAEVSYEDMNWLGMLKVQQYQTLHPFDGPITAYPYRRMPEFAIENMYNDLPGGFVWTNHGDFTYFTIKKNPVTEVYPTYGSRYQMRPGLSLPIVHPGWFFKPRIQYNVWGYSLQLGPLEQRRRYPKTPNRGVPMFDIDSGLIFERKICIDPGSYIQTLEPRLYYLYVPYVNQNKLPNFDSSFSGFDYNQLFRENRFNGLDRVGDANQLTMALSTRFLQEITGSERLTVTLGKIYYFQPRRVTLCNPEIDPMCVKREMPQHKKHRSNYVAMARYHLQEEWTLNALAQYNPYRSEWDQTLTFLQYRPSLFTVFNFGYLFLRHNPAQQLPDRLIGIPLLLRNPGSIPPGQRDPLLPNGQPDPFAHLSFDERRRLLRRVQSRRLEQTDISAALALSDTWRLLARHQFDIRAHQTNQVLAGIEHQGCCTALRLTMSLYLQPKAFALGIKKYETGVYLQFVFKGLGGIGSNNVTNTLQRAIPGYEWRPNQF